MIVRPTSPFVEGQDRWGHPDWAYDGNKSSIAQPSSGGCYYFAFEIPENAAQDMTVNLDFGSSVNLYINVSCGIHYGNRNGHTQIGSTATKNFNKEKGIWTPDFNFTAADLALIETHHEELLLSIEITNSMVGSLYEIEINVPDGSKIYVGEMLAAAVYVGETKAKAVYIGDQRII